MDSPKTLQQAILFYADPKNCIAEVAAQRWPDGKVICPTCGRNDVTWQENARVWQCKSKHSRRKFSVKVGTVYEDSPIGLDKWLTATWLLSNCKNGVSSYEIARAVGVTQKTGWFMLHRIRLAMKDDSPTILGTDPANPVEVDETFVGGKPRNMHAVKRMKMKTAGNGNADKGIVFGMLARGTREVRAQVVPNVKRETLQNAILDKVGYGSTIYSDGWLGYDNLKKSDFVHETVNHVTEYVRGNVHTNGIENFWSCLKRSLRGTYVAVEPFHLDAYVTEQVFRFNNRHKQTDGTRMAKVLSQVSGKRLTYAALTGKVGETTF